MKKLLRRLIIILIVVFVVICGLFYFLQEIFFFPQKLDKNYHFSFNQKFDEINVTTSDGIILNGLLFKADSSKGLIFYLHGNAGSLEYWGLVAKTYNDLKYDVFIIDYRGFGKSEGSIKSQKQFFKDIQSAYNEMLKLYNEDNIIIIGYSIGTGPATKIASTNNPKLLILQAPFYNMKEMMKRYYPIIPTFILKYELETNNYIEDCEMPVVIFHGDQDEVINHGSSIKLKEHFKKQDTLITLPGQRHNGMTYNQDYIIELQRILNRK